MQLAQKFDYVQTHMVLFLVKIDHLYYSHSDIDPGLLLKFTLFTIEWTF